MKNSERQLGMQRIGEYLIANGDISRIQLQDALSTQKSRGKRLGKVLIELGYTTEAKVVDALAKTLGLCVVNCQTCTVQDEVLKLVPKALAEKKGIVPLKIEGGRLIVAMADPDRSPLAFTDRAFINRHRDPSRGPDR